MARSGWPVDGADAAALADFWAKVISHQVEAGGDEHFAAVNKAGHGPAPLFIQVPERGVGKNRLHLDLATVDWAAEVDRIVGLGAKRLGEYDQGTHWLTFADPEGNVFDLVEIR